MKPNELRSGMTGVTMMMLVLLALTHTFDASAQDAPSSAPAVTGPAGSSPYLIDTGPLRVRDQFLLGMGFLAFDPVSADVLEDGDWQIDTITTVTNTFAHSPAVEEALEQRNREGLSLETLRSIDGADGAGIFHLDGETYRFALAARRGIGNDRQIEIMVPILAIEGGSFDGVIEDFHDAFSLGQAGRLGQPRGEVQAYVRSGTNELVMEQAPPVALGDIVIGVRQRLHTTATGTKISAEALVKLPTGSTDRLSSNGSVDGGLQLLMTKYFSKSCIHASLGVLALGGLHELDIDSQLAFSGMAAWEIGVGSKSTVLLQATVSQSPFRDLHLDELSELSTQLTLGAKRVIAERSVLFVGITENLANFNNTADIGLHLGVTTRF